MDSWPTSYDPFHTTSPFSLLCQVKTVERLIVVHDVREVMGTNGD